MDSNLIGRLAIVTVSKREYVGQIFKLHESQERVTLATLIGEITADLADVIMEVPSDMKRAYYRQTGDPRGGLTWR